MTIFEKTCSVITSNTAWFEMASEKTLTLPGILDA